MIALCSWAAVTQNFDATLARGVVSSKKCFSIVQNTAAARTLVGVRASQVSNAESDGSGRILFLQCWINSFQPVSIVNVSGGGGGVTSGEICPGGRTSCKVGGMAAARINVSCSGETRFAMSAKPLAALA